MRANRAKRLMAEGGFVFNGFFNLPDPMVVELMGKAGYDAVSIDLEHMAWGPDLVRQLIMAAEVAAVTFNVAVTPGDWGTVLRVLNAGAQSIQVKNCNTLAFAKEAVAAVRYPPIGERGAHSYARSSGYGEMPYTEHTASSNEETLLILTIEHVDGLDIVEEIAAMKGVDAISFGPHDLAESMGIRDGGDPRVREAIEEAAEKIRTIGQAKLALAVGYPRLKFTMEDLLRLGTAWGTVNPTPELVMLNGMKANLAALRSAEDAARAVA